MARAHLGRLAKIAQLVEQFLSTEQVVGSSPTLAYKRKSRVLYGVKTASFQGESAWSDKTRKVES